MNHVIAKKDGNRSSENWFREIGLYVVNIRGFTWGDWLLYTTWIGTLFGLFFGVTGFVVFGSLNGVSWPGYVWFIPIGVGLFVSALAIDDIGHRTLYKSELRNGEGYIHKMIVATAVPSVMALCLGYEHPETFRMPALSLILLSFFYSAIDEAMHWRRYFAQGVDRVEMWSHFIAIFGHVLMISCWWQWYDLGYPGVNQVIKIIFPQ